MSIQSLLQGLEKEAEQEKVKILEEAEKKIASIRKDTEEKAQEIRSEVLRKAKEEIDIEEAKMIGQARSQANMQVLEARRKGFDLVLHLAKERLRELSKESDYAQQLESLIQEAVAGLNGKLIAEVSAQDVPVAQNIFKKLKREAEVKASSKVQGGVIVKSPETHISVENTLDSRLQKAFNILTSEIAQKLWPE
jgi:V/A-type H+-transporting ATPase subunit E